MKNHEFQLEVIRSLSAIETKQGEDSKKITQLFEFHNENQGKINSIKDIKERLDNHEKGHSKFRVGAALTLFGLIIKSFWKS